MSICSVVALRPQDRHRVFENSRGAARDWRRAHFGAVSISYSLYTKPTYSSWLNQVEIWFNIITQKAIRRDSFQSVKELAEKVDQFVKKHNKNFHPFAWVATAESILQKIDKILKGIRGTQH